MNEWDVIAPFYDSYFSDRTVDVEFWVNQAKRFGSPVLEFACGTGRLTIPIARSGIHIVGLDISRPMLRVAKKKILKENKSIRDRVTLRCADVTKIYLPGQKFNVIFSPWGFPATTEEEENSLFQLAREHLTNEGYFVIDIYNFREPSGDWKNFGVQDYKIIPKRNMTILRQVLSEGSAQTRINHLIFFWDIVKRNGNMKRFITERTERVYTKKDMEHAVKQHGFVIEEEYGNYNMDSWDRDSPRTIMIARRK